MNRYQNIYFNQKQLAFGMQALFFCTNITCLPRVITKVAMQQNIQNVGFPSKRRVAQYIKWLQHPI